MSIFTNINRSLGILGSYKWTEWRSLLLLSLFRSKQGVEGPMQWVIDWALSITLVGGQQSFLVSSINGWGGWYWTDVGAWLVTEVDWANGFKKMHLNKFNNNRNRILFWLFQVLEMEREGDHHGLPSPFSQRLFLGREDALLAATKNLSPCQQCLSFTVFWMKKS